MHVITGSNVLQFEKKRLIFRRKLSPTSSGLKINTSHKLEETDIKLRGTRLEDSGLDNPVQACNELLRMSVGE
jgi:hypothetical protein